MATKTIHGKKVGAPTKAKTKHLKTDKHPAILGWCTAGQHAGTEKFPCPGETENYACYCKCHKEK